MAQYGRVEFPQRAEVLSNFGNYKLDISHWAELATQFQRRFQDVHTNHNSAVLIVRGAQGAGKSAFCNRLIEDFDRTANAPVVEPDKASNLWHALVANGQNTAKIIENVYTDAPNVSDSNRVHTTSAPSAHAPDSAMAR